MILLLKFIAGFYRATVICIICCGLRIHCDCSPCGYSEIVLGSSLIIRSTHDQTLGGLNNRNFICKSMAGRPDDKIATLIMYYIILVAG